MLSLFAAVDSLILEPRCEEGRGPAIPVLMALASCRPCGGHSLRDAALLLAEECFVTALRQGGAREERERDSSQSAGCSWLQWEMESRLFCQAASRRSLT